MGNARTGADSSSLTSPSPDPRLKALLAPKSMAIIGATERLHYGGRFMVNLRTGGYEGRVYPVNPRRETVFGHPCFPSISAVPEPVDLAAVIIPAEGVLAALEECAAAGAKAAVVISAGFSEVGPEGEQHQRQLAELARRTGLRILGPNCLGLANVTLHAWASANILMGPEVLPPPGTIGLVSQSGASAFGPLMTSFTDRRLGLRSIVSTGNEADLGSAEIIRALLHDPEVNVVAALVEGFRDGDAFARCVDEALLLAKPLVVLKVGRTEAGRLAALTHTAALTGSDAVQSALFAQRGVVRVEDYDELAECAGALATAALPEGRRVCVISHSGGIGGLVADKLAEQGLLLPAPSDATRRRLAEILEGRGAAANPADITGHFQRETFSEILDLLAADPTFDLLAVATGGDLDTARMVEAASGRMRKPLLFFWTGSKHDTSALPYLQRSRVPVVQSPTRVARIARALVDLGATRKRIGGGPLPWRQPVDAPPAELSAGISELVSGETPLSDIAAIELLRVAGLTPVTGRFCRSEAEALEAAAEVGYPVVMKANAPGLLHKSDAGAVRTGLTDAASVRKAFQEVTENAARYLGRSTVEGVLVQEMVANAVEVLMGLDRDPQFGQTIILGLGGVSAEILAQTALRLCPVDEHDAEAMISEVRGLGMLLEGFRGAPPADRQALRQALVALSRLGSMAGSTLESVDVNPLMVLPEGKGVRVVDAVVIPRGGEGVHDVA